MRAFIGSLLSAPNQDVADTFGARIADASRGILRPVPRRSAHITHVFLGEIDDRLATAIAADLDALMAPLARVPFRLGHAEVFRGGREPRLVLAHVDAGRVEVADVARKIVDRLRRHAELAALAPARSPHVTLARFRRGAGPVEARLVTALLGRPRDDPPWHEDGLDEIQLVRSELTPTGQIYEVVARARPDSPA